MKIKKNKINLCMLIGFTSFENLRLFIPPEIGVVNYLSNYGHEITWMVLSDNVNNIEEKKLNKSRILILPCIFVYDIYEAIIKIKSFLSCYIKRYKILSVHCANNNYNLLFVRNEIFNGIVSIYLKKKYNLLFIYQIENPIEQDWEFRKIYSKNKFFWYLFSKIEKILKIFILNNADLIIPVGNSMGKYIQKVGINESKTYVIPAGGVNLETFSNITYNLKEEDFIKNSIIAIYIGSLDKARQINKLIYAFSKVNKKINNTKLLIVGDGSDKKNLEKIVKDLNMKNCVIFVGLVPHKEVPKYIKMADIGISIVPPLEIYKYSVPIKMHEYMAAGIPVIANEEIPEQKFAIEDSNGGILVKFEIESFSNAIIELVNNRELSIKMGENGKNWLIKNRSFEKISKDLIIKFENLLEY